MARKQSAEEYWREQLTEHTLKGFGRRFFTLLPTDPRCRLCNTPFGGPGGVLMRFLGRPQSRVNPTLCDPCEHNVREHVGGVEIELSMLFADVRGSTGLAERLGATEFRQLMGRFYSSASTVLVESRAMLGSLAGDEVIGYYFPAFAGQHHASVAIQAGRDLLKATGYADPNGAWLPVGVGIHTGVAFAGVVEGAAGLIEFAVLGDAVNTTARLASLAGPGEMLTSEVAASAAGIDTAGLERRELELRGRSERVHVLVHRLDAVSTQP